MTPKWDPSEGRYDEVMSLCVAACIEQSTEKWRLDMGADDSLLHHNIQLCLYPEDADKVNSDAHLDIQGSNTEIRGLCSGYWVLAMPCSELVWNMYTSFSALWSEQPVIILIWVQSNLAEIPLPAQYKKEIKCYSTFLEQAEIFSLMNWDFVSYVPQLVVILLFIAV